MGETRLERKAGVSSHDLFLEVKAHCDTATLIHLRHLWLPFRGHGGLDYLRWAQNVKLKA